LIKERVFEYVELSDDVPIQKLRIIDQLRILLKRFTYDAGLELKRDDALTREEMELRADLITLLTVSTEPIRRGEKKNVILSVSNRFDPVLESVIKSKRFQRYYNITVRRPQIEYDIHYFILIKLEVKR
jgi:hypothetical protein